MPLALGVMLSAPVIAGIVKSNQDCGGFECSNLDQLLDPRSNRWTNPTGGSSVLGLHQIKAMYDRI